MVSSSVNGGRSLRQSKANISNNAISIDTELCTKREDTVIDTQKQQRLKNYSYMNCKKPSWYQIQSNEKWRPTYTSASTMCKKNKGRDRSKGSSKRTGSILKLDKTKEKLNIQGFNS